MLQPKKVNRPDTPLAATPEPQVTYKNLGLARSATNDQEGVDTKTPATSKDSSDYRKGFKEGLIGKKTSSLKDKYEGKNQYTEKGRWEGQNANKNKK